jgi:hypothetical protein
MAPSILAVQTTHPVKVIGMAPNVHVQQLIVV